MFELDSLKLDETSRSELDLALERIISEMLMIIVSLSGLGTAMLRLTYHTS